MATYTPIAASELSDKTADTTLATGNIGIPNGTFVLTCGAYDDAQGHPSQVTWGNRLLANRPPAATRNPGAIDIAMSLWVLPRVRRSTQHALTLGPFAANIDERCMAMGYVIGRNRLDQHAGANFATATSAPITQLTSALGATDNMAVAYFVSEGPSGDTPGTMEILDGGTWTAVTGTQRVGTTGGGPATNVTLNIGWLELTSAQATQARITGATSRRWTCAIVTLRRSADIAQAVVPTDVGDAELILEDAGVNPELAAYVYNFSIDEWEVYSRNDMSTRLGHNNGGVGGWSPG